MSTFISHLLKRSCVIVGGSVAPLALAAGGASAADCGKLAGKYFRRGSSDGGDERLAAFQPREHRFPYGARSDHHALLPRAGRHQTLRRLRHQVRGLAADGKRLERQISRRWQRRFCRIVALYLDGPGAGRRLRRIGYGHRPFRRRAGSCMGAGTSGKDRRFRLARHPRGSLGVKGNCPGLLRKGSVARLFQRLLGRGPRGADGGAAVPGRLRRDRRRRPRELLDETADPTGFGPSRPSPGQRAGFHPTRSQSSARACSRPVTGRVAISTTRANAISIHRAWSARRGRRTGVCRNRKQQRCGSFIPAPRT